MRLDESNDFRECKIQVPFSIFMNIHAGLSSYQLNRQLGVLLWGIRRVYESAIEAECENPTTIT